jgi:hypothetical protein
MLMKYKTAPLSLASTFVVLVFIVWVISGSQSFQTCFQNNKHTSTYNKLYESSDVITKSIVRLLLNAECSLRFFGDDSSALTAFATLLIAAFTWTLWRSTNKMWVAAEQQLKIASDALAHTVNSDTTTQRAYMGRKSVGAVELRARVSDDGKVVTQLEWVPIWENHGQTPAIDVTFCAINPIICEGDVPENTEPTAVQMGPLPKIAIGARQIMAGGSVHVGIDDVIKCSRRNCKIFVIFRLEYRDVFADTPIRVTQYCEEMRFIGVDPVDNTLRKEWPFVLYGYQRFQIFT